MKHHFTIDVEEHFQVVALERHVSRESWGSLESRVEPATDRLLTLLDETHTRSTCFVLGWIAERCPALVRRIADAGHEVASHGYAHRRVTTLTPDEFRDSVRRSKAILEDVTGQPVAGYRAPSFSIVPGREWALDILVEEGYRYDSSLFPIRRRGYGYASGGRDIHTLRRPPGDLLEIPPATLRVGRLNLPAAGGAYFRLLPPALVRTALRAAERRGEPATFYLHPWEIDPGQPRFPVPASTRLRHYGGLAGMEGRLRRLLSEFSFQPIARTLEERKEVCLAR